MSKRKHRRETAALYDSITRMTSTPLEPGDGVEEASASATGVPHDGAPISDEVLAGSKELSGLLQASSAERRELPKMKKFRFQLLHQWLMENVPPCRAADVGGGKGLLAYLLNGSGWEATTIDPQPQALPDKYKDLAADHQIRIPLTETVHRIDCEFQPQMARGFDLLIAMHAHGCMAQLIDAAVEYRRDLILLPCCIIQEPLLPPPGIHWIQCLVDHAKDKGLLVEPFRLNFKGQNIGLYARARV